MGINGAKGKELPQSIEGERAILGGLLLDNEAIPGVMAELRTDDFYREAHRNLFRTMTELFERRQKVDWVTVPARLKEHGLLESVGGVGYIVELSNAVPSTANIMHYVEIVKDKALHRRVIHGCQEAVALSHSDTSIDEIVAGLQNNVLSLVMNHKNQGPAPFRAINRESFRQLEEHFNGKTEPGLKTGFAWLDEYSGGLRTGDLIVVCARPSMGKSAFAANVAANVALNGGFVMVYSLEMQNADLWGRIISRQSGVPFWRLRKADLDQFDLKRIIAALGDIDEIPLWIDDSPSLSPSDILFRTEKVALETKITPSLIVIDYLQIMKPEIGKHHNREREIASMSAASKNLAKRIGSPVILISQLNREVTKRKDQRPQLQDLRESGAIEQDADLVIGIFRKWPIEQTPENKTQAEIGILKQRNGPIGWDTDISWDPNTVSFREPEGK